jgi:CheY-like chemotaxis protein
MRAHGMATDALDGTAVTRRVLLLGCPAGSADRLREHAPEADGYAYREADHPLEAGVLLAEWRPDVLVVDCSLGRGEAQAVANLVRANPQWGCQPRLVLLATEDDPGPQRLVNHGRYDAALRAPWAAAELAALLNAPPAHANGRD